MAERLWSTTEAAAITGATVRQIDYWHHQAHLITPARWTGRRGGAVNGCRWSDRDLVAIAVLLRVLPGCRPEVANRLRRSIALGLRYDIGPWIVATPGSCSGHATGDEATAEMARRGGATLIHVPTIEALLGDTAA